MTELDIASNSDNYVEAIAELYKSKDEGGKEALINEMGDKHMNPDLINAIRAGQVVRRCVPPYYWNSELAECRPACPPGYVWEPDLEQCVLPE